MDERREIRLVQQVINHALAGVEEDPHMAQRVLVQAENRSRLILPGKKLGVLIVAVCLMLTASAGLVWSLSREYFREIAQITLTSGDYEDWSLTEKRYMTSIMGKYGLIGDAEAKRLSGADEADIDTFMLARYGFESNPELNNISIDRIAMVEMGPYVYWSNETWVWYCNMMFEIGLWTEHNDVDVYEMPGEEAIPPEEAMAIAAAYLAEQGHDADQLRNAQVIWHYMTHASDTEREDLVYLITFRFWDGKEQYVFLTPEGKIK